MAEVHRRAALELQERAARLRPVPARRPDRSLRGAVRPQPPLLPRDPRGRARVRGLALIAAADGHPLITPRIRTYLEKELKVEEARRNLWLAHWTLTALEAIEGHLAKDEETGRYCHGE